MINTIERSYYPDKGLSNVEQLTGYTFSSESYAHTFIIRQFEKDSDGVYTQTDFDSSVAIQLHFLAADGVTQVVNGAVENGAAVVTLPPECYTVTGRFGIVIMAISGSTKYVIYAAAAYCYASNSDIINISDGSVSEIQAKMDQIAQLSDAAHWVAIFARNIGDIEGRYDAATTQMEQDIQTATTAMQTTVQTAIDNMETGVTEAVNDYYDMIDQQNEAIDQQTNAVNEAIGNWETMVTSLRQAVENADLNILNTPNLIKRQPGYVTLTEPKTRTVYSWAEGHDVTYTIPAGTYPYGDPSWSYAYDEPYVQSFNNNNQDEISETVVSLTGDNVINDKDGASYGSAVQFTVTNPPAQGYNNSDNIIFNYGSWGCCEMVDGEPTSGGLKEFGNLDMTPGATYTMSCWARVTSGTKARLCFWHTYNYKKADNENIFDIDNTGEWKRYHWTFIFNPTEAQFYTYDSTKKVKDPDTGEETEVACVRRSYNWRKVVGFGVCRTYAGTVQLAGFRLTAGGLYGNNTVDTIRLQLAALENRVSDLQTQASGILSSIAPVETGTTATANYAAGELLVWKNKLYKASAAITSGATLAVGTNLTATTLAAELAALNV